MSATLLLVAALVIAVLCVPTVAGMTAWGLAGGDGTQENPVLGVLAMLVGFGGLYNAVTCWLALTRGVDEWQWWAMWAPPAAGVVGILLSADELGDGSRWDWVLGLGMQLALAVPALLVWAAVFR